MSLQEGIAELRTCFADGLYPECCCIDEIAVGEEIVKSDVRYLLLNGFTKLDDMTEKFRLGVL